MDKSKFKNKKEWRKFGFGVALILAIIATIQVFTGRNLFPYFYGAGFVLFLLASLLPILLKPLFILFSYLGFGMGWVMTRVILTILYFLILTPIGLISRLFGGVHLDLRFNRDRESYWITRDQSFEREQFKKQF